LQLGQGRESSRRSTLGERGAKRRVKAARGEVKSEGSKCSERWEERSDDLKLHSAITNNLFARRFASLLASSHPALRFALLSIDQTPFRKDERERVKKRGAVVMTIDQIEGLEPIHENWGLNLGEEVDESGDPPRVWESNMQRPGEKERRTGGAKDGWSEARATNSLLI